MLHDFPYCLLIIFQKFIYVLNSIIPHLNIQRMSLEKVVATDIHIYMINGIQPFILMQIIMLAAMILTLQLLF